MTDPTKVCPLPCPGCGHVPGAPPNEFELDNDFVYPVNRERTLWNAVCTEGGGGGCGWSVLGRSEDEAIAKWNRRDAAPAEAAQGEVAAALQAAIHALRSYQYGNGAPDLAEEVADRCERALAPKAAQDKCDGNHGGPPCADPECWNQ